MIPTAPLRLRNRLSETILAALHDSDARQELQRLAWDPAAIEDATAEDAARLRARARRASEVLAACPTLTAEPSLDEVLGVAAALFDGGLHFEVHELLEPYWTRAEGSVRQALQGLIQIAVGYQHFANGNFVGARVLLAEGSTRARGGHLSGLDLDRFADAVAAGVAGLQALPAPPVPRFPRRDPPE